MLKVKFATNFDFFVDSVSVAFHAQTPETTLIIRRVYPLNEPSILSEITAEAVKKIIVIADVGEVDTFTGFSIRGVDEQITPNGRMLSIHLTKGGAQNATDNV